MFEVRQRPLEIGFKSHSKKAFNSFGAVQFKLIQMRGIFFEYLGHSALICCLTITHSRNGTTDLVKIRICHSLGGPIAEPIFSEDMLNLIIIDSDLTQPTNFPE